jgi:hypothetical protein
MESVLSDAAGRNRLPATMPGFHRGRTPRNKGLRCPPDPPPVEKIIAIMRAAGDGVEGTRLTGADKHHEDDGHGGCLAWSSAGEFATGRRAPETGFLHAIEH